MELEKMENFFENRLDEYEEHMLEHVEGCKEGYLRMGKLIPENTRSLLDLGCGTGLELEEILHKNPFIEVTGIDLSAGMLSRLKTKFNNNNLKLIREDYVQFDYPIQAFDVAISFQTLHHLSVQKKQILYSKLRQSLKENGRYIECDYMVTEESEELYYNLEYERMTSEQQLNPDVYYHYDTPCTVEHQVSLLSEAGFNKVDVLWREGNTTLLIAYLV